jgi:hypothetical protein
LKKIKLIKWAGQVQDRLKWRRRRRRQRQRQQQQPLKVHIKMKFDKSIIIGFV